MLFSFDKKLPSHFYKKKKKIKWLENKRADCVSQAVTTGAYPGFEGWFSHCPMSQKAFLPYLLQVPNKKKFTMVLLPVINAHFPLHIYFRKAAGTSLRKFYCSIKFS